MNINNYVCRIRMAANIGMYGSMLILAVVIVEHYLAQHVWIHEITANDYSRHLFTAVGLVLAVIDIAMVLFSHRRQTRRIRQMDSADEKLKNYASLIRTNYFFTLVVAVIVGVIIVVVQENTLIMLLMLLVVALMLNYPNMYKMKADMGLDDDKMKELFGDKYIK